MPIPDFQSIMMPLLKVLSDGFDHTNADIINKLGTYFDISKEEMGALLPSGKMPILTNRVAWAKIHLKRARLIESPSRGVFKITQRGHEQLNENIDKITVKYLMKYPEFQAFRGNKSDENIDIGSKADEITPQEHIELGFAKIYEELSRTLIENIKQCSSTFFEKIVIDLLLAMGYGGSRKEAGSLTRKTGDEGIDGIINEDKLGLDVIYIQAKKWENTVGRPEIQKFAGALLGKKAKKGIFITTSSFSKEAIDYASAVDTKIILIDGNRLTDLMISHGVGVSTVQIYEHRRIDSDYFSDD